MAKDTDQKAGEDNDPNKLTEARLRKALSESSLKPAAFARKTFITAGVVIFDRGRHEQATAQFAARGEHQRVLDPTSGSKATQIILDAEDLVVGYRLDVGVPLKAPPRKGDDDNVNNAQDQPCEWRGLMARSVVYGLTGNHAKLVRSAANRLFREERGSRSRDANLSWQNCLEDGFLALTSRLIPRGIDTQPPVLDAFVEEAVATWAGEPMGVPIAGKRKEKVTPADLPCGRVTKAPTSRLDPTRRSPVLRFGYPYRFGLRSVYTGGISLPLGVAEHLYNGGTPLGGFLTIPALPSAQGRRKDRIRRFLRHERIDAPILLLPEEVALRHRGSMDYESASRAVIRSVSGTVYERQYPTVTQRVFVAPGVSQHFACMHGVFDLINAKKPGEGLGAPRFGQHGVRRDGTQGGFPVVTSDLIVGMNGVPYPSSRRISIHTLGDKADSGDLVYSTSAPARARTQIPDYTPYYPDPAISGYVIGIRIAGSDVYLNAKEPCIIKASGAGYDYPNTRPLVVTVQLAPTHRSRSSLPTLEELVAQPGSSGRVSHLPPGARRFPGAVEAVITLAPGDDFELDVWCIPEGVCLAQKFALIESIASLAITCVMDGEGTSQKTPPSVNDFCNALKKLLPDPVPETIGDYLRQAGLHPGDPCDWDEGSSGPGGLPLPGPKVLCAIGQALYRTLGSQPLSEIAAVRTLRVTHATDLPSHAPRFVPPQTTNTVSGEPIKLCRLLASDTNLFPFTAEGEIEFDWATTSSLEISADMVSPSSDQFDDVRRGRAIRDRRLGYWPQATNKSPLPPGNIFGFDVNEEGDVNFPKTCGVSLFRLDEIPLPYPAESGVQNDDCRIDNTGKAARVSLAKLFQLAGKHLGCGTSKFSFQFTDGLARSLDLRVTACARHRDQMRTAPPLAHNGKWLRDGQPLTDKESSLSSACIPVWLNASVRPAEPAARTPIPAFRWKTETPSNKLGRGSKKQSKVTTSTISRSMVVRIPIARPWFSSGEDERLGIVLWPPDLFSQSPTTFEQDQIFFNGRYMDLSDFYDEDLGPGGKFITRWGGDPTRIPAESVSASAPSARRHSLIPATAFLDLLQDTETGFTPELIKNVLMPIRAEENEMKADDGKSGDIPTLAVSLLAFKPKFDVIEEQWYVDLALEHVREAEPFVRLGLVRFQPHAERRDLQVSYPVVQWTQLLPRRSVKAQRCGNNVDIRVEGLSTSPPRSAADKKANATADDKTPPSSNDLQEVLPVAKMSARIIKEMNLPIGLPTQSVVCECIFDEDAVADCQPCSEVYNTVWKQTLKITPVDNRHARYFVLVEERDTRLPATYASEPVSPQQARGRKADGQLDESLRVESGVRFSVKIPI